MFSLISEKPEKMRLTKKNHINLKNDVWISILNIDVDISVGTWEIRKYNLVIKWTTPLPALKVFTPGGDGMKKNYDS